MFKRPRTPSTEFVKWSCNPLTTFNEDELDRRFGENKSKIITTNNKSEFSKEFTMVNEAFSEKLVPFSELAIVDTTAIVKEYVLKGGNTSLNEPLYKFRIETRILTLLTIDSIYIEQFRLTPKNGHINLKIVNSYIKELRIDYSVDNNVNLIVENVYIGKLVINQNTVGDFQMKDGGILDINCPPPWGENPFHGSVYFDNVFFPRTKKEYLIGGAQPYRNIRFHLQKIENYDMAALFHSAELAIAREDNPWSFNNFVNRVYEIISDFGGSILQPLLWLIFLFVLSILIFDYSDGVVLTKEIKELKGWQTNLDNNLWRSIVFSFQHINPFGIFQEKSLLVAKNNCILTWSMLERLFSLSLITMFLLAVRRRFKMKT